MERHWRIEYINGRSIREIPALINDMIKCKKRDRETVKESHNCGVVQTRSLQKILSYKVVCQV